MKYLNFLTSIIFFLNVILTFSSCQKSCPSTNCNTGTLNTETCKCDCLEGYRGDDCSTALNAKFLNFSRLTETCSTSGATSYNVSTAIPSGKATEFMITGLWEEPGVTVTAKIDISNGKDFIIERQAIGAFLLEGQGSINTARTIISVNYTALKSSGAIVESCQATIVP